MVNAPAGQPCWTATVRPAVPRCVAGLRLRRRDADGQPRQPELSVDRRLRRVDPHHVSRRDQLAAVRAGRRAHQEHVDAAFRRRRHAGQRRHGQRLDRGDGLGGRRHRCGARHDLPQPGRRRSGRPTRRAAPTSSTSATRCRSTMPGRTSRAISATDAVQLSRRLGLPGPDQHVAEPGQRAFTLHMNAIDLDGQRARARLARRSWRRTRPRSSRSARIDTPGQGETISGTNYANFGWVLSRVRRADPPGRRHRVRSTSTAWPSAARAGGRQRADLTALFPGYPGINTALGVFSFNTLAYANGLHTIVWVVTDNAGVASGVGSRFFSIFNTSGALTAWPKRRCGRSGPDLGRRLRRDRRAHGAPRRSASARASG